MMNQIKEFDKRLRKTEDVSFVIAKCMGWIFGVIGCFLMILPLSGNTIGEMLDNLALLPIFLLSMTVLIYLSPYMRIKQGGRTVSIYKILKFLPVGKEEICQVRMEYLNHLVLRIGVIIFIMQQAGAMIDKSSSIGNVLYPLVVTGAAWLAGYIYIRMD
ncbi:MAG: hypothetical protein E7256_10985 [Lachnospiraceae bacterium]|nr:hypothetical protein [Lachnospiraceae bacterium]